MGLGRRGGKEGRGLGVYVYMCTCVCRRCPYLCAPLQRVVELACLAEACVRIFERKKAMRKGKGGAAHTHTHTHM